MPMFMFYCGACRLEKQRFQSSLSDKVLACPKCGSTDQYNKKIGKFSTSVRHSNLQDIVANDVDPYVNEIMQKIGTEMLAGDTKTLENVFGEKALKDTFYQEDTYEDEVQVMRNNGIDPATNRLAEPDKKD